MRKSTENVKTRWIFSLKILFVGNSLQECPNEQVILRDIHRTFPAHDFFKEAGGLGQDGLYKLSKVFFDYFRKFPAKNLLVFLYLLGVFALR